MNNEIMKIILDYNKNGKMVDRSFFSRILDAYFSEHGITGFLNSNVVLDKETPYPSMADFFPDKGEIKVFAKSVAAHKKWIKDNYGDFFTLDELSLFFLMNLAQTILHVAEHVKQEYFSHKHDYSTVDSRLLHATEYDYNHTLDRIIKENYPNILPNDEIKKIIDKDKRLYKVINYLNLDLDLRERLAQIKSFDTIRTVVKNLDLHPHFFKFFDSEVNANQIRGYKLNGSFAMGPTLEFIDILNKHCLVDTSISGYWEGDKEVSFERAVDNLSFEDRINLGLPITSDEFNKKCQDSQLVFTKR